MKILQISPQVPVPPTDGGKLSIWGNTVNLSKRGHKIDFVCYLKHSNYEESYKMLSNYCTPYLLKVKTDNSLWGAIINLFSRVPYNASKYNRKELLKFIRNYFSKNEVDIVQVEHLHMGWIVDEIRKLSNAKIVLRQQNLETLIMKRFYERQKNLFLKYFAKIQYKKFLKFEPYICSKFDKVIMISTADEAKLKKLNPSINSTTIPSGVNANLLNVKRGKEIPFSLIHIGSMDWYPNFYGLQWFLEKVYPRVVEKFPESKLFIYGGGDTSKLKITDEIKQNINIVGFIDDLWEEISDKSLAIVPLKIGGGIRIKILEMLAAGQIILTTSIGSEGIELEDGKNALIANSAEEFNEKITEFFNNKFNLDEMRNEGKNLIRKNYTWDKIALRFENEYKKLVKVL